MERFENRKEDKENSDNERRVKVADRDAMLQRLLKINDEKSYQEEIYQHFLRIVGNELPPIAIAGVIVLTIDRYTSGDRSNPTNQLLRMFVPHFVDAMIDNTGWQRRTVS